MVSRQTASQHRSLTVAQFVDLVNAGAFSRVRVEMLDGVVVKMPRIKPFPAVVLSVLNQEIGALLSYIVRLRTRMLFTADQSVPAPDLYLYRGPMDQFRHRFPAAADMNVVMEVSDNATLFKSRGLKATIYARNAIPEYWIVNCVDRQVEIYTEPTTTDGPPRYRTQTVLSRGETATLRIEGQPPVEIPLTTLFGE